MNTDILWVFFENLIATRMKYLWRLGEGYFGYDGDEGF